MTATVNAKTVRAVLGVAHALGLDAGALAQSRDVAAAMTDVDARFPYPAWIALWQDISRLAPGPSRGIDAAERLPWGHWDVVDYLIGTADTLGTALRRFARYFAIISTAHTHEVETRADAVHLVRRSAPDCHTRLLLPAEFAFATTVAHLRLALGTPWSPREVSFAAPAPASVATPRRFFDCPVHFDAPLSEIVIEPSAMSLPMHHPDPELSRILERHAQLLVGELGTDRDFVAQVRRVIVKGLPDADVSLARTARQLGVSVRTLQRRLQENGLSFDDLYDNTRSELARRYLEDPGLSIQETAHLLAFGDVRGFYRAFKRWEGSTPADYRRRARGPEAVAGASRP